MKFYIKVYWYFDVKIHNNQALKSAGNLSKHTI